MSYLSKFEARKQSPRFFMAGLLWLFARQPYWFRLARVCRLPFSSWRLLKRLVGREQARL